MNKNDIVTGVCTDYTHDGLGVVKSDNFTFFVRHVLVGEEIEFAITKCKKTYGYGRVVSRKTSSSEREAPLCPHFGRCGGCQIQHMSYAEQLRFKKALVQQNCRKIGGIDTPVQDVIGASDGYHYRNKAQVPLCVQEGNVKMGFYRLHSNDIISMNACLIQSELINEIMAFISQLCQDISVHNVFKHVLIKHAFETGEVMVVFVVTQRKVKHIDEIVNRLTKKFGAIKSVVLNVNTRRDNVILGDEEHLLYGCESIQDSIDGLTFSISSKSFYQVNPIQAKTLYETALEMAQITNKDSVVDLYCGVGTISLFLARKAKRVTGVEIVEKAIEDARSNAVRNGVDNVEFICSDAATYAAALVERKESVDVVVVDPPRKGCDENTLQCIVLMQPKRIVYVSCNPATLARDLRVLEDKGYTTKIVQPVDMFPNTYHVETVALLTHNK